MVIFLSMEKHLFMLKPYLGELRSLRYILPATIFPWRLAGAEHKPVLHSFVA